MSISYLFDRRLLRQRRSCLDPLAVSKNRLHHYLALQLRDRLKVIKKDFSHILVLGDFDPSALFPSSSCWQFSLSGYERPIAFDDEFLPFAAQQFDLVISFMEMHYFNDIPGFLQQVKHCLKPDGLFLSVFLGQDTLWQLRHITHLCEEEIYGGVSGRVAPMMKLSDAAALMQRAGFFLPVVDMDHIEIHYPNTRSLLNELKHIGLSNVMAEQRYKGAEKRFIYSLTCLYDYHYQTTKGVKADFTAIYLSGWRPSSSQRQPLLPGSATARLADFI